jgi:AraC-like DNA-binding protein
MIYLEAAPASGLARLVKCYWSLELSAESEGVPEPVIPDGCPEIVFNLAERFKRFGSDGREEIQPSAIIVGPMRQHVTLQPTGNIKLFGIRFFPAGAFPFLGFPFCELADRIEDLYSIWGDGASRFEERLYESPSFAQCASVANSELLSRLRVSYAYDNIASVAANSILTSEGMIAVNSVSSALGISNRQLERKFNERIGISPKVFSRIVRMQTVLKVLKADRDVNILDLALSQGFYDQSHFIKEFREFSGQTPTEFIYAQQQLSEVFIT